MAPGEKTNKRILEHVEVIQRSFTDQGGTLQNLAKRVAGAFHQEGRLWLVGSGPLASIAHLVSNHFLHRLSMERPPLPAIALGQDFTLNCSLQRDGKGHLALSRQLRAMAGNGDILLAFTGLSADASIDDALETAKEKDMVTAVVYPEGCRPGRVEADFSFTLETQSSPRVLEGSLFFGQLLCELVEGQLFGV